MNVKQKADIIRFLTMARDSESAIVVNPAGKVVASESDRYGVDAVVCALIATRTDLRGCVVYSYSKPTLTEADTAIAFGITKIYYEGSGHSWDPEIQQGIDLEQLLDEVYNA